MAGFRLKLVETIQLGGINPKVGGIPAQVGGIAPIIGGIPAQVG